jgi:putative component of membrane protein insertase Oxa1/YidC/SpoIIIJ protein YidD
LPCGMSFRKLIFTAFLMILFFQTQGYAGEGRWEKPWGRQAFAADEGGGTPVRRPFTGEKIAEGLVGFFREYISPVDGDRCPSYPTCSQYSLEAIRKHGVLLGLVMTFDRLIHESDEVRGAPAVKVYRSYRHYDPVENNDFWWVKK